MIGDDPGPVLWSDRADDDAPHWTAADVTAARRAARDELDVMRGESDGQISARWGYALPVRTVTGTKKNAEDWAARLQAVALPGQRVMVESGGRNGRKTGTRTPTVPLARADGVDLEDLFSDDEPGFQDFLALVQRSAMILRARSVWTVRDGAEANPGYVPMSLVTELADRLGYGPYGLDLLTDGPAEEVAARANGAEWHAVDVGPDPDDDDPGQWTGLLAAADELAGPGPVPVADEPAPVADPVDVDPVPPLPVDPGPIRSDRSVAAMDLTPESARWELDRRAANRIGRKLRPEDPWPRRLEVLAHALGVDVDAVDRRGWVPVQARCRAAFECYGPELLRLAESSPTEMSDQ